MIVKVVIFNNNYTHTHKKIWKTMQQSFGKFDPKVIKFMDISNEVKINFKLEDRKDINFAIVVHLYKCGNYFSQTLTQTYSAINSAY